MAGHAAAQPFSMHARGVHTYETSPLLDFSYQFRVMLKELRCVGRQSGTIQRLVVCVDTLSCC